MGNTLCRRGDDDDEVDPPATYEKPDQFRPPSTPREDKNWPAWAVRSNGNENPLAEACRARFHDLYHKKLAGGRAWKSTSCFGVFMGAPNARCPEKSEPGSVPMFDMGDYPDFFSDEDVDRENVPCKLCETTASEFEIRLQKDMPTF